MTAAETRINALFEELVPAKGKADTVAGEIIRAVSRIIYRNYNDGDHVGVGYGKETCNPAARYLMAIVGGEVRNAVEGMWGISNDDLYIAALAVLEEAVLTCLQQHQELKTEKNRVNMWDYRNAQEDMDDSYDEEDWQ